MVDQFSHTGEYFHSITLTGLTNGSEYFYYVRCFDTIDSVADSDDYLIHFGVRIEGEGEGDEGGDSGGGGGGGAGGGGGGGFGPGTGPGTGEYLPYPPLPGNPSVEINGWAYPLSEVNLLKDGASAALVSAFPNAGFTVKLYELKEGVYTFSLWARDTKDGNRTVIPPHFMLRPAPKQWSRILFCRPR
jgi:hypothetical protein